MADELRAQLRTLGAGPRDPGPAAARAAWAEGRHRRRRRLGTALPALAVAAGVAFVATEQLGPGPSPAIEDVAGASDRADGADEAWCDLDAQERFDRFQAAAGDQEVGPWGTSDGAQEDLLAVHDHLATRGAGVVAGTSIDYPNEQLAIVIEPNAADQLPQIEAALAEVTTGALAYRVEVGCVPSGALHSTRNRVSGELPIVDNVAGFTASYIHALTSSAVVEMTDEQLDAARARGFDPEAHPHLAIRRVVEPTPPE